MNFFFYLVSNKLTMHYQRGEKLQSYIQNGLEMLSRILNSIGRKKSKAIFYAH